MWGFFRIYCDNAALQHIEGEEMGMPEARMPHRANYDSPMRGQWTRRGALTCLEMLDATDPKLRQGLRNVCAAPRTSSCITMW